jgi:glycosyltransferase involved in cell wall biosynthesis
MRVSVLLEQTLSPVPGGTGRYSGELAAALARTAAGGHTVHSSVAWHRDVSRAVVAGVQGPSRLPLGRRPLVLAWSRRLGPAPRADVVHAPTLLVPPARHGAKLVVTIHDAVPWTHPETLTARGVRWHQQMAAIAAAHADAIVVPTNAVAAQLERVFPAVTAGRLVIIPQGVTAVLASAGADSLGTLRLPPRYLLSLATMEPRKGLDVLLEAMALPQAPDLPLVVVGQAGWGGVDVATRAAQLGLAERVIVLGRVPDAQLAAVLAGAEALVMPSRAEGFGLPVLEAMAAGVPAVTSDDAALVEVGGGAPLIAPRGDAGALADALARIAGDDALRGELSRLGRLRAADFDWDECAASLWALYASLC